MKQWEYHFRFMNFHLQALSVEQIIFVNQEIPVIYIARRFHCYSHWFISSWLWIYAHSLITGELLETSIVLTLSISIWASGF